jgi:hypothetical protein
MKIKVNLRVRDEELTAYVDIDSGGQRRCTSGRCRAQGITYTVAVESILNGGAEETRRVVTREARRVLREAVGSRMVLCPKHFAQYLARITNMEEMPVEIIEV